LKIARIELAKVDMQRKQLHHDVLQAEMKWMSNSLKADDSTYIDKHGHVHQIKTRCYDNNEDYNEGAGMGAMMISPFKMEKVDAATQTQRGLGGSVYWEQRYTAVRKKEAEKAAHTVTNLEKKLKEEGHLMCNEERDQIKSEILTGIKRKLALHIKTFIEDEQEKEKLREVEMLMPKNR